MVLNKQYQNRELGTMKQQRIQTLGDVVYFTLYTPFNANKIINDISFFFLISSRLSFFVHSVEIATMAYSDFCSAWMVLSNMRMFLLSICAEGSESLINLWHVIHVCTSIIIINYDLKTDIDVCIVCCSLEAPMTHMI